MKFTVCSKKPEGDATLIETFYAMNETSCGIPRILIAALKGGAGKTLVTIGLVAALRRRGLRVSVFKKGPDYIDANWLGFAAGRPCYNLDSYLMDNETLIDSFIKRSLNSDIAVIEGARGLFDGVDSSGAYSTSELAKTLGAPIILIVEGSKMSGTAAALTKGCQVMDPELLLEAVILNRVAGERHENILKTSILTSCGVPTIGAIAKQTLRNFPQRHLGLLPIDEHPAASALIDQVQSVISQNVDIDAVVEIARKARKISIRPCSEKLIKLDSAIAKVKIGFLKDAAFQFYYEDNLDALRATGADLIEISALSDTNLPDIHGLYIGGGFPETNAQALAANISFKESLRDAINRGLPVYAECGGLMYLSRSLTLDDREFPMVGVFPMKTVLKRKPQGLGYIEVEVVHENPFFPLGAAITGHEFHYSSVVIDDKSNPVYAFKVLRGFGMDGTHDGICVKNTLGSYLHVHALGVRTWADSMARKALDFRSGLSI